MYKKESRKFDIKILPLQHEDRRSDNYNAIKLRY